MHYPNTVVTMVERWPCDLLHEMFLYWL